MIPSISRPLSLTSRTTGVLLTMRCTPMFSRTTHFCARDTHPCLLRQRSEKTCQYGAYTALNTNKGTLPWHLTDPRDLDEALRYLPKSIREASRVWWFGVGAGVLQTNKQGYLLFCFFVPSAVSLIVHGAICICNHRDTGLYTLVSGPLVCAPRHQSPGHLDNQNHTG